MCARTVGQLVWSKSERRKFWYRVLTNVIVRHTARKLVRVLRDKYTCMREYMHVGPCVYFRVVEACA